MSDSKNASKKPSAGKLTGRLSEEEIKKIFLICIPPICRTGLHRSLPMLLLLRRPLHHGLPTDIDIPEFIKRIQCGNVKSSAHKILEQNIMGAMCARLCPTEELCEEACVRNSHENKPVAIGLLQRYATDDVIEKKCLFSSASPPPARRLPSSAPGRQDFRVPTDCRHSDIG